MNVLARFAVLGFSVAGAYVVPLVVPLAAPLVGVLLDFAAASDLESLLDKPTLVENFRNISGDVKIRSPKV